MTKQDMRETAILNRGLKKLGPQQVLKLFPSSRKRRRADAAKARKQAREAAR